MVNLSPSAEYSDAYYVEFNNGNWILVPHFAATSLAASLRDAAHYMDFLKRDDVNPRDYDDRHYPFDYGTVKVSSHIMNMSISISCNDGHYAWYVHSGEARQLMRLLRDEGY